MRSRCAAKAAGATALVVEGTAVACPATLAGATGSVDRGNICREAGVRVALLAVCCSLVSHAACPRAEPSREGRQRKLEYIPSLTTVVRRGTADVSARAAIAKGRPDARLSVCTARAVGRNRTTPTAAGAEAALAAGTTVAGSATAVSSG